MPPAQSNDEPVLYVNCTQSGKAQDTGYQVSGFAMLKLCTHWQGQAGGTPSKELYKLRRSVRGLKPGERLQFYASVMSGSGTDNDGYTADMVSTGDGATKTVVTGRDGPTWPLKTFVFEDKPSGSLPPSAYPRAEILRTPNGAVLRLTDIYGPNNGGEGYFYGVCIDNAELTREQREKLWTFQISEAELDNWDNLTKSESGSARGPSRQSSWNYSVTVTSRIPDLGEAAVEVEGYDQWIPEGDIDDETKAGNEIVVRAWVHKTGDRKTPGDKPVTFTFELTQYSREKGVCTNWPTQPGDSGDRPDLRILKEKNTSLEIVDMDLEARTARPVKEAKLVLSSFDYAAWAVLKVTAKDKDGKPLKVVLVQHEGYDDIPIPRDEDKNRIADAWQEEKGVTGLPAEWDEAEVKGQSGKGDGLSLYQKYRGVVTATGGGRSYVRLEPRKKSHFVIDPQGIFDESRWLAASGIRPYKVLSSWTNNRQVDINRGFGGGRGKWAVRVELDDSKVNESLSAGELSTMRRQWAFTQGAGDKWTPKTVEFSRIYTGRIRYTLRWLRDQMLRSLQAPTTDDDRVEEAWLLTLGIPRNDLISKLSCSCNA
jgi:hypothetical protein